MKSVEEEICMLSLGHGSLISQDLQDGQIAISNVKLSDANTVQLPTGYFGNLYFPSSLKWVNHDYRHHWSVQHLSSILVVLLLVRDFRERRL